MAASETAEGPRGGGQAQAFYGLALAVLIGFVAYIGRGVIIPFVVAGFLWVSGGAWPRLVACAAGFLGARLAVTRLTRGAEVSRAP